MKTLRKGDDFKRVPEGTQEDRKNISELLSTGWNFCDRATWKREARDKGKKKKKGGDDFCDSENPGEDNTNSTVKDTR